MDIVTLQANFRKYYIHNGKIEYVQRLPFPLAFAFVLVGAFFLGLSSSESSEPRIFFPSARLWSAVLVVISNVAQEELPTNYLSQLFSLAHPNLLLQQIGLELYVTINEPTIITLFIAVVWAAAAGIRISIFTASIAVLRGFVYFATCIKFWFRIRNFRMFTLQGVLDVK